MQLALGQFHRDGKIALRVQLTGRIHAHRREHAEAHQVLPRLVQRGRAELLALVDHQPPAHEVLVHRLEPADGDRSDIGARPGFSVECDVHDMLGRAEGDRRQFDLRQRIAVVADCAQQSVARRQYVGGDGRSAGFQAELFACIGRHRSVDAHLAQVELLAGGEARRHLRLGFGRQLIDDVGQRRDR